VRSFTVVALLVFLKGGNVTYASGHLLPNGVFVRIDSSLVDVNVHAHGNAFELLPGEPVETFEDSVSISDEVGVAVGVTGIAMVPPALASAVNAGAASINTPFDGTTFIPTVDTSLTLLGHASASNSGPGSAFASSEIANDFVNVGSFAGGTFQLELSAGQTQAMFYGTLYLVGVGSSMTTESVPVPSGLGGTISGRSYQHRFGNECCFQYYSFGHWLFRSSGHLHLGHRTLDGYRNLARRRID